MVKILIKKVQFIQKLNKLDIYQIHGKKLSYNNYNDIFSALMISEIFTKKYWYSNC